MTVESFLFVNGIIYSFQILDKKFQSKQKTAMLSFDTFCLHF